MSTCVCCLFRVQLEKLGSAMESMRAEQEEERAQLKAAEAAARQLLQQSREEVESLRAKEAYLTEDMGTMQGSLEVGKSMHHQRHI